MSSYYKIIIPGRPIAKSNMYGVRVIGKRGLLYTTREMEDYELLVGSVASEVVPQVITGYTSLYVRIYQHGKKWIDIDNCFKALQDGLDHTKKIKRGKKEIQVCQTGIANDKLFQLIIGERVVVATAQEQRVEMVVAPYEGIFRFVDHIQEAYGLQEDYIGDLIFPELT